MDFTQQLELWEKGELLQGKIMIGIGVLFLIAFVWILRSQNELLRGVLIPMGILLLVLIGYGGAILYTRPIHTKTSIELYEKSEKEAVQKEIEKHTNDNKAGKTLLKIYPLLAILALVALWLVPSPYYKGMAIGFALVFIATFIIDYGFVFRSDVVLKALGK